MDIEDIPFSLVGYSVSFLFASTLLILLIRLLTMAFWDQLPILSGYAIISKEHVRIALAAGLILIFIGLVFTFHLLGRKTIVVNSLNEARQWMRFFYVSFLKPHNGDAGNSQQGALESFYKAQVSRFAVCLLLLI